MDFRSIVTPSSTTFGFYYKKVENKGMIDNIESYIINDKAVIIFWKDRTKTVATVSKDDKFDVVTGFGVAMFKHEYKNSKASYKRMLACIKDDKLKDYMEDYINNNTFENLEKTRKFIKSLKVTGKREKIDG